MPPRNPTPDILVPVSQETGDAVAMAMLGGTAPVTMHGSTVHWVWLSHVLPNPYQTRLSEDPEHIIGLARSIRAEQRNLPDTAGLQQVPLGRLVWRLKDRVETMEQADHRPDAVASLLQDGACVQLAFGHSRAAAFELLHQGLSKRFPNYSNGAEAMHVRAEFLDGDPAYARIPVRIVHLDDKSMWSQAVRENHERKDLTPLEEARAIDMAISALGLTTEQAGKAFGYERSTTANKIRLLNLPKTAQDLIQSGWMTERHGRALLRLTPAPHLQAAVISDLVAQRSGRPDVEASTVAELERIITRLIDQQIAMPAEEVMNQRQGWADRIFRPPAWPLEWTSASPAVVGPCRACQYRVIFGNETFPRCTKTECYQNKTRIWDDRERERQRAAALAAVNAPRPAAPAAPASAAPASTAAEASPARQLERIEPASYGINFFGSPAVPAALLEHGLCGKEQCDCFCLARMDTWGRSKADSYVRPDPANAPDIAYACKSGQNLAARKRRLAAILEPDETQAENRRRADLAAQTKQSRQLLREFYEEIGAAGLASSARFMGYLLGRSSGPGSKSLESIAEIWERLFWIGAENTCRATEWKDYERIERWDLTMTQKWIDQVRSEIAGIPKPRPAHQPGPGDSQRTNWQDGWDDDDEGMYLMLSAYPKPLTPDDIQRIYQPRVVLRMIEDAASDKAARGLLWQRYNELSQTI
jgi:ParB-like chromosome segregation protein Spo0J